MENMHYILILLPHKSTEAPSYTRVHAWAMLHCSIYQTLYLYSCICSAAYFVFHELSNYFPFFFFHLLSFHIPTLNSN